MRGAQLLRVSPAGNPRQLWCRDLCSLDVKTTLDLNDQLLADAKPLAAQQRTGRTRPIEEGLQLRLRAPAPAPTAYREPEGRCTLHR